LARYQSLQQYKGPKQEQSAVITLADLVANNSPI
jgi:hypothetical protein